MNSHHLNYGITFMLLSSRMFAHACIVFAFKVLHYVSDTILAGLTSIYEEDEDRTILQQDVKALCNYIYLRSPFLQANFNYNLNYLKYSSRANEMEDLCMDTIDENGFKMHQIIVQGLHVVQLALMEENIQPAKRHIAILIPGIFESIEIFTSGGRTNLARGLLEHGCEVWVVQLQLPLSFSSTDKRELGMAGYSASSLLALVNYICSRGPQLVGSVSWICHSSGCDQLLSCLQLQQPSQRATAQERAVVHQLQHLTTNLVLLSPLLLTVSSLSQRDGAALEGLPAAGVLARAPAGPIMLLHEVLLHEPNTAYAIFGSSQYRNGVLLLSLQSWRDVLSARAYCNWLVAPLARLVLGWRFRNITATRRTALLQHLFMPVSSRAVIIAAQAMRSSETHSSRCAGYGSSVSCCLRWCINYTVLATEGTLRILRWLFLPRRHKTGRSSGALLPTKHIQQLSPTARTPCRACRVLAFVGGEDVLVDWGALETSVRGLSCAVHVVPGFEHMDVLWADSAPERIFQHIYHTISTSIQGISCSKIVGNLPA